MAVLSFQMWLSFAGCTTTKPTPTNPRNFDRPLPSSAWTERGAFPSRTLPKRLFRNRRTLITRSRGSRTVIRYSPNVLFGKVSRAGRFTSRGPSAKSEPNGFKNFCPAASMESWTGRPPQQRAVRHAGIPAGGILHSFGLFSKYKSGACRPTSHTPAFAPLMDMDFAIRCPLVRRWRLVSGFCSSARTFAPRFF
jgi:hypothetical protein